MPTVADVAEMLESFAPGALAEEWDNVGLLIGQRSRSVERLMTCLTVTGVTAAEAVSRRADLIVSHHPFPFRSLKRITDETSTGQLLLELVGAGIAVYSPHTAFDSTTQGINQMLAEGLGLEAIEPMAPAVPTELELVAGIGRMGRLTQPQELGEFAERVKRFLDVAILDVVGAPQQLVGRVAIGCGSACEMLELARTKRCDTFVTGEMRFHDCLAAESYGMAAVLAGHYATERFAVERLAEVLAAEFPEIHCWASVDERDPLVRW